MFVKDRKGRIRGVKLFNQFPHMDWQKMIAVQPARITSSQIEAARRAISKSVKRVGKYRVHIQPVVTVSAKPSEVRMGKGKGSIDHNIARVKAGQLLFSINGLSSLRALAIMRRASRKLPLKIKIIQAHQRI
jgi:large subunit ribosomal protein L16